MMNVKFVQDRACERVQEIFDAFDLSYFESIDYFHMKCPVHNGDNERGMFWAKNTNHWQCITRGCQKDQITGRSNSIFGLIRGIMAARGTPISFRCAVDWTSDLLCLRGTCDRTEQKRITAKKEDRPEIAKRFIELKDVVGYLNRDCTYFPSRGISQDILARYHVSICNTPNKSMYQRAFFPVLDVSGRKILGWSGRSIFDKCEKCGMYHSTKVDCTNVTLTSRFAKWKHTKGFRKGQSLYNIWFAKSHINKSRTAIICEGAVDVWRLEMSGFRNSVGIMGTSISKEQRLLLQQAGALTLILALDNDEAGRKGTATIVDQLSSYFRIFVADIPKKDIGEMNVAEITQTMKGVTNGRVYR